MKNKCLPARIFRPHQTRRLLPILESFVLQFIFFCLVFPSFTNTSSCKTASACKSGRFCQILLSFTVWLLQVQLESRGREKSGFTSGQSEASFTDSFTEPCLSPISHVLTAEVSQGSAASHVWRSSPARHVSSPTLIVTSTSSPSTNTPSHHGTPKHTVHHLNGQQSDMMEDETQRQCSVPGEREQQNNIFMHDDSFLRTSQMSRF